MQHATQDDGCDVRLRRGAQRHVASGEWCDFQSSCWRWRGLLPRRTLLVCNRVTVLRAMTISFARICARRRHTASTTTLAARVTQTSVRGWTDSYVGYLLHSVAYGWCVACCATVLHTLGAVAYSRGTCPTHPVGNTSTNAQLGCRSLGHTVSGAASTPVVLLCVASGSGACALHW